MLSILLITARLQKHTDFTQALSSDVQVRVDSVSSASEALHVLRMAPPHLAVVDVDLPDAQPMVLVQQMLMVNAMVNTAVVSAMSEDEFHEASEGLGVLCPLPLDPGKGDALALLAKLKSVMGLPS